MKKIVRSEINNYKSNLMTLKLLLKSGVIPYIVVDYSKKSLVVILNRFNRYISSLVEFIDDEIIELNTAVIPEDLVDACLIESTRLTIDFDYLTEDRFNKLLSVAFSATEMLRNKLLEVKSDSNEFTEDDFNALLSLSHKAKYDSDYWSL